MWVEFVCVCVAFLCIFYLFIYLCIFGCIGFSLLRTGFSLVAASRGYLLFVAVRRLLIAVASLCRAQALGTQASVVVAHGLSSCGSRALEHRLSSCGTWA